MPLHEDDYELEAGGSPASWELAKKLVRNSEFFNGLIVAAMVVYE